MSIDLDISATIMNYVLISSHNVDVAHMLACVAGGFFFFGVFFLRGSQSYSWVTAARMLKRGRNRKRHRPLPSPLPHRFLFRPRFCFRAVLSLILRNTKHERKYTTTKKTASYASYAYVWACPIKMRERIERVQYFKSKGNVATMLKQSLQEIKPTWHIKTTYNIWVGVKWFNIDCQQHFLKEYA